MNKNSTTIMLTQLTQEQLDKFVNEYIPRWMAIGSSTEPCDFEAAKAAIRKCYKFANFPEPKFFIGPVNNPVEGAMARRILSDWAGREFESEEDLNRQVLAKIEEDLNNNLIYGSVSDMLFGNQEFWLAFYDFFRQECKLESCKSLEGLNELAKVAGWWTPLARGAIVQHRPESIHFDRRNRLHNVDGPAVKFRGRPICDIYAIHGVHLDKAVHDKIRLRTLTVQDIENERNAEVRRVMIERYGQDRYIQDAGAIAVHSDDFGTLYRKDIPGDESIFMVKVVNATPEPDGTFKDYWLRVDPNAYGGLRTARAAVASTWRNPDGSMVFESPEDYDPEIET